MKREEVHRRQATMASSLATKVNHRGGGETWLFESMSAEELEKATTYLLHYDGWGGRDYEFWEPFLDKLDERERRIKKIYAAGLERYHFWVHESAIAGWSSEQIDTAARLIDGGRKEDIYIEPYYLAALCKRLGIQANLKELEGLTAEDRLKLLNGIELEKRIDTWEARYYQWADDLLGLLLLSYPVLVGTIVWVFFGLPLVPEVQQDLQSIPSWAIPILSWAAENNLLFPAYYMVSFGPAVLAAFISFGVALFANLARRRPPKLY